MPIQTSSPPIIIRLSSLGDTILSTAAVRATARATGSPVFVVTQKEFADVYRLSPHVLSLGLYDRSSRSVEWVGEAAPTGSAVIDLQNNRRSRALARVYGWKVVAAAHHHRLRKLAAVYAGMDTMSALPPVPLRMLSCVQRYIPKAADDEHGLEIWTPKETDSSLYSTDSPAVLSASNLVTLAPAAKHRTKEWPPERWASLARSLCSKGYKVVFVGGKDDADTLQQIAEQAGLPTSSCFPSYDLYQTLRIIDASAVVVANDSSAVHMAAARRIPVVAIFGSTVPSLGFAPFRVPHAIAEVELSCRPCTHIGRSECPKGHLRCLRDISHEDVLALVRRQLISRT